MNVLLKYYKSFLRARIVASEPFSNSTPPSLPACCCVSISSLCAVCFRRCRQSHYFPVSTINF